MGDADTARLYVTYNDFYGQPRNLCYDFSAEQLAQFAVEVAKVAQPSPGSQGDAVTASMIDAAIAAFFKGHAWSAIGDRVAVEAKMRGTLEAPLAARQPVGEPVPFAVESKAFETHAASRKLNLEQHPLHYLFLDPVTYEARQAWKAALAFAPPAQAVDLGQFRDAVDNQRVWALNLYEECGDQSMLPVVRECDRLLALIDSHSEAKP